MSSVDGCGMATYTDLSLIYRMQEFDELAVWHDEENFSMWFNLTNAETITKGG